MTPGEQQDEWIAARLGKVTASRMSDVAFRKKDGSAFAARRAYMIELMAERFTGMSREPFLSQAMLWGIETEPSARAAYTQRTGRAVELATEFVDHPALEWAGASPDGYVGQDGLIEIKCPDTSTHIGYLIDREIPEKYIVQMHWQMACTGRAWCDFVSFDSRMPMALSMLVIRCPRDEKLIAGLVKHVSEFLRDMETAISAIESGRHIGSDEIEPPANVPEYRSDHVTSDDIAAGIR